MLIGLVAGAFLYVWAYLNGRDDMRRFAHRLALFGVLLFVGFSLYTRVFIGGDDNSFYARFTTFSQPSLVVGSSRAAQGIRPTVFNSSSLEFTRPLYNFCFTEAHSPYGPTYFRSIRRKLKDGTTGGLYLLEVNPWVVSSRRSINDNPSRFIERGLEVSNTRLVNSIDPNYEFLLQIYAEPFYKAALYDLIDVVGPDPAGPYRVTSSGWTRHDASMDSQDVAQRSRFELKKAKEFAHEQELSKTRLRYLRKTISFLRRHGDVYLVRLPLLEAYRQQEEAYLPQFDSLMTSIARDEEAHYINMSGHGERYRLTDGEHLYRRDALTASKWLLSAIKKIRNGGDLNERVAGHQGAP